MCRIFEFSKYYVIFIYFQAAVSALLAVSVLYVEKNQNKYYIIFRKFDTYQMAIIKNKGTPNLLNSSDNIDGTQTFLTQLSAVKLYSIEKRGKIQTTKMTKFSNLNICSTKREPNPQWPPTATIGLNFWSEVGSPIPMTSQWPQTAFARLLLICSLILDLSSTGLIKKRGTQCFKSRKREPYPYQAQMAEFEVTSFLIRLLGVWSRIR